MSDSWLMFIPTDPEALPLKVAADKAVELLKLFVPQADEVLAKFFEKVEFHSGMANWSGVRCPNCEKDIADWWSDAMGRASQCDFKDLSVITPCCEYRTTLNDLNYSWPAGFSRFALEAMNPNVKDTTEEQERALSQTLGFALRKIWTHL